MFSKIKKCVICLMAFVSAWPFAVEAQNEESILKPTLDKLAVEVRTDFEYQNDNEVRTAFSGKYINVILKGDIGKDFHYFYRQRVNKTGSNIADYYSFWSGTDMLFLTYDINSSFSLTAGKLCVAVGGWEYDVPPIEVYYASNWWNRCNCYELGAELSFLSKNKNHKLTAQFTNSPFTVQDQSGCIFSYNLIWHGTMDWFKTSYSTNFMEYEQGRFVSYISLGNAFSFGKLNFYIDMQNRGRFDQSKYFLSDASALGEVKYDVCNKLALFVKGGYDRNECDYDDDDVMYYNHSVVPGTSLGFYGGGFEWYPWKGDRNIRIHAFVAAESGTTAYGQEDKTSLRADVGLTWRLNFINK